MVDNGAQLPPILGFSHPEDAVVQGNRPVRWKDVHVPALDALQVPGRYHPQRREATEKLGHQARVRGIEVDDDHEGEAAVRAQPAEHGSERIEAARRCTEANDERGRRDGSGLGTSASPAGPRSAAAGGCG
jgi:hypothetical protein